MGEAVEPTIEQAMMMPMSPEMLMGIHRVFAEKISFEIRGDSASITFGTVANVIPSDSNVAQEVMIPQVVCFLTIPHVFRLRDLMIRQCALLEQMVAEHKEAEAAKKDA